MASLNNLLPVSHHGTPGDPPPVARSARRPTLSAQETDFLHAYYDARLDHPDWTKGATERHAVQQAGFDLTAHPPGYSRSLAHSILKKIDHALDARECLIELGMGQVEWVRTLAGLIACGEWKYVNAALKLWGLALGVFSPAQSGEGASILIGAKAEGPGAQAQVAVRWPQRQLPPEPIDPAPLREADTRAAAAGRATAEAHYRDVRLTLESARGGADMPADTPDTGPGV